MAEVRVTTCSSQNVKTTEAGSTGVGACTWGECSASTAHSWMEYNMTTNVLFVEIRKKYFIIWSQFPKLSHHTESNRNHFGTSETIYGVSMNSANLPIQGIHRPNERGIILKSVMIAWILIWHLGCIFLLRGIGGQNTHFTLHWTIRNNKITCNPMFVLNKLWKVIMGWIMVSLDGNLPCFIGHGTSALLIINVCININACLYLIWRASVEHNHQCMTQP